MSLGANAKEEETNIVQNKTVIPVYFVMVVNGYIWHEVYLVVNSSESESDYRIQNATDLIYSVN